MHSGVFVNVNNSMNVSLHSIVAVKLRTSSLFSIGFSLSQNSSNFWKFPKVLGGQANRSVPGLRRVWLVPVILQCWERALGLTLPTHTHPSASFLSETEALENTHRRQPLLKSYCRNCKVLMNITQLTGHILRTLNYFLSQLTKKTLLDCLNVRVRHIFCYSYIVRGMFISVQKSRFHN